MDLQTADAAGQLADKIEALQSLIASLDTAIGRGSKVSGNVLITDPPTTSKDGDGNEVVTQNEPRGFPIPLLTPEESGMMFQGMKSVLGARLDALQKELAAL